jgi:invasion protein IalB
MQVQIIRKLHAAAAAAILCAGIAAPAAAAPATDEAAAGTAANVAAQTRISRGAAGRAGDDRGEQRICTMTERLGSLLRTPLCKTRQQWLAEDRFVPAQ